VPHGSSARPHPGARVVWTALITLALSAGARADAPRSEPLPWRVPGRVGFTVDAAAFPDTAGAVLDVYVRISPSTLLALARDAGGQRRVRLTTRLRGAYGGRGQVQEQEFSIAPEDSSGGLGKVMVVRIPTKPGRHRLFVRVADVLSRKRGLVYAGANESGQVEGEVTVRAAEGGRELSDIEFVWSSHPGGPATLFERGGRTRVPDPERLYGLYAGTMHAAFCARGAEAKPWHWQARVLDADGQAVAEQESTAATGRWLYGEVAADVTTDPAGGYRLELKVWQEGDAAPLERTSPFSIAWQVDSWLLNPSDVQDNVHFLLSAAAEEDFARLSPGEQEHYLDEFWRERDPSPGTGVNEARVAFLQRVAYANRHWSHPALGKGMFSDMGRVYIRYGEPSEIQKQVMPTGDEGLDAVVQQILVQEDRSALDVPAPGPWADMRPFELWIYDGPIPRPPDADPKAADHPRRRRLIFLFVDDHGTGDYRLRYSTE
jgi:GWxTD domain-containing protein